MKKWLPFITIAVIVVWTYGSIKGFNNTAVVYEEDAKTTWSNVESSYQRRTDLIPNLVATVKGYAAHESETLEAVIKARAAATSTKIDAGNLSSRKNGTISKGTTRLVWCLGKADGCCRALSRPEGQYQFLGIAKSIRGNRKQNQCSAKPL